MRFANFRTITYWTATAATAFVLASGGIAYLVGAEIPVRGMIELGYPPYFVGILGFWKLLGAAALLVPRAPRLKEWAYAGVAFDLTGAAFSHFSVGHAPAKVAMPLVLLMVAVVSWAFRPPSRRLGAGSRTLLIEKGGVAVSEGALIAS
ncbi:MAG: DoxX family protein [Thermoanaerobaculia bacterium]|nr:DoxX family protein [Thermoanaerobaculia bacterium]